MSTVWKTFKYLSRSYGDIMGRDRYVDAGGERLERAVRAKVLFRVRRNSSWSVGLQRLMHPCLDSLKLQYHQDLWR